MLCCSERDGQGGFGTGAGCPVLVDDESTIIQPGDAAQYGIVALAHPHNAGPHFADRIGGDKGGASYRFANDSRQPVSSARVGTGSGKVVRMCGSGGRCGLVLGETGQ